jgi:ornithine carbamoyltransferase
MPPSGRARRPVVAAPASPSATAADSPDHLLCVSDLTCFGLADLLDVAAAMKADPGGWIEAHRGETLACFMDPPTTGLAVAIATAGERLGMAPVMQGRAELERAGGEPIADIARSIAASASAILTHGVTQRTLRRAAPAAGIPVVNARSDRHAPCQALADLLTVRERLGRLDGIAVAFVGDGGDPTCHSLMEAGALARMDVRVACPEALQPDPLIAFGAAVVAERHDGRVTVTDDPYRAVAGADAVCTSPWVAPGREHERAERRELLRHYQVHPGLMVRARHRSLFLHSLPARRGEEVSSHVIDGDLSVVWLQAANRVPTGQAVIHSLLEHAARAA